MPRFVRLPRFPLDFDRARLRWISSAQVSLRFRLAGFFGSWTHARTAAASSQPRAALRTTLGDFAAASEPQDRRIETAIVRHRRDTGP